MPAGEPFGHVGQQRLHRAVQVAEQLSGLTFSVYVGLYQDEPRGYAERLHRGLADPDGSVLVFCDPDRRALEIVTGVRARRLLDDVDCRLAAASMQVSFHGGDLLGGMVNGIQQLGQAARRPTTLHAARLA